MGVKLSKLALYCHRSIEQRSVRKSKGVSSVSIFSGNKGNKVNKKQKVPINITGARSVLDHFF